MNLFLSPRRAHFNCIFRNKARQCLKFGRNLFSRVFYKFYFSLRKSGCHPPFLSSLF
ncbi:MAG: large repetitive protein [Campylobacter sp.]|nr:MAG: large repetitive protein [Campylobacter sp.]